MKLTDEKSLTYFYDVVKLILGKVLTSTQKTGGTKMGQAKKITVAKIGSYGTTDHKVAPCKNAVGKTFSDDASYNSVCQNILGTLVNEQGEKIRANGKVITKAYVLGAIAYGHYKGKATVICTDKKNPENRKSYSICLLDPKAKKLDWSSISSCGCIRKSK